MDNITSPCVRNCCLDKQDICLGCHRSLQEILDWGSASELRRIEILDEVKSRRQSISESSFKSVQ